MSDHKDVLLGVLGGIAIGAVLGILFAPDKGSETRKKIEDTAKESKEAIAEKTKELTDQLAHTFSDKKGAFAGELDRIVKDMSVKADDIISTLEEKLAQLKAENEKLRMN